MTTKQEALKHLDELEEKVVAQGESFKQGVTKWSEQVKGLIKANEDLKHQAEVEYDRAERLLKERDRLQYALNGYADLGKALANIRGDAVDTEGWARIMEGVKKAVQEEVAKLPVGSGPTAEGVQVTESVPYVDLKVSSPWVPLDESTVEGQIAVLAVKGKLPEPFSLGTAAKQRELEYAVHGKTATIQKALDALVGKYKVLERKVVGNQYVYSLRSDAKSRVKESETREAVEAKE